MRVIFLIFLLNKIAFAVAIINSPSKEMYNIPLFFISDNQVHNFLTNPTALRSKLADSVVSVAIRPPLQDLFSKDLFIFLLERYSRSHYTIHLGDALNISCKSEWNIFQNAINGYDPGKKIHEGWVMLPGNHDGFFFGNTTAAQISDSNPVLKSWVDACATSFPVPKIKNPKDVIFTKDVFVKNYYKHLISQGLVNSLDFPNIREINCFFSRSKERYSIFDRRIPMGVCEWENKRPGGLLSRFKLVYPQKDDVRHSFKSYIIQELNLSQFFPELKVKAILMDTSDYRKNPTLVTGTIKSLLNIPWSNLNSGIIGSISDDQLQTIKGWLINEKKKDFYIFLGHHPLDSLDKVSRKKLSEIFAMVPEALYISSHTHSGFIKDHGNIKEINLGSVTDFPNQVMTLYIQKNEKIENGIVVYPQIKNIVIEDLIAEGFCNKADYADKDPNPNYHYLGYKKIKGLGTPYQIYEFTLDNNLMGLFKVFKKLGVQDPIVAKLENKLFMSPEVCGAPLSKKRVKCLKEKSEILNVALSVDDRLYTTDLRNERIKYGACQTLWATLAKKGINK